MFKKIALIAASIGIANSAFAAPVDLTTLTTAIDFSSTTDAVLAVAAALMAVYIAWKAASMVLRAVKGL
jgi:uncharacterized membrane protein YobD (UPF0266 family)